MIGSAAYKASANSVDVLNPTFHVKVAEVATPSRGKEASRLDLLVPGTLIENDSGVCFCTTHAIPLRESHGPVPLGALLRNRPAALAPFFPNFRLASVPDFHRAAFIDTETTGLGAGAGVYCFMVGVGSFETLVDGRVPLWPSQSEPDRSAPSTHFVVRQYFMRNPAEEASLLEALATLLKPFEVTVTFNGRTFDLPLLRTRFRQNRQTLPPTTANVPLLAEDRPHLDLLHPARRLWRRRLQSCRLINLEQMILHLERTEDDVPGHQIPALYSEYVRSQDASQMRRVFYHNCEDIISMVAIAERLTHAFDAPPADQSEADLSGLDWLALGQSYEKLQKFDHAEVAYRRALDYIGKPQDRGHVFPVLGRLQKRQGRWQEASETWQMWLSSVPGNDPTPYVELAKYCEWQLNDFEQAEMWTAWALHNIRTDRTRMAHADAEAELEHRRQRVRKKHRSGSGPNTTQTTHEE